MTKGLENNLLETWGQFKELASTEIVNAVKRAMRKSAKEIQQKTVENARAGIKTYNNHPNGEYEQGSILDAVRVSKINDRYDEDLYIKVHVMGTGKPNSKTFRFRFLEKGTRDRYATTYKGKQLSKPRYLGRIQPRRYFAQANNSVNVEDIYLKEIEKAIDNINK